MDNNLYLPSIDQGFGLCIGPQDLIFPFYNVCGSNYYRPWKWYKKMSTKDFGSTIQNEKDKYKISLDAQHFKPDEINVKVVDNEVVIEGNHKEREDGHGFISRSFKRRYFLPKDCLADSVVSSLSSDGILIVTADKKKDKKSREIRVPIKLYDSFSNEQVKKPKADISKSPDVITKHDIDSNKKCTAIMVKEDHCRLLKPELLGEAAVKSEKIMMQDKIESDKIIQSSSKMCDQILDTKMCDKTSEKIEEKYQESTSSAGATMRSVAGASATKLETSNVTTLSSETLQMRQSTSSCLSSISSNIRETNEKISEIVSDISTQLKEAAENI